MRCCSTNRFMCSAVWARDCALPHTTPCSRSRGEPSMRSKRSRVFTASSGKSAFISGVAPQCADNGHVRVAVEEYLFQVVVPIEAAQKWLTTAVCLRSRLQELAQVRRAFQPPMTVRVDVVRLHVENELVTTDHRGRLSGVVRRVRWDLVLAATAGCQLVHGQEDGRASRAGAQEVATAQAQAPGAILRGSHGLAAHVVEQRAFGRRRVLTVGRGLELDRQARGRFIQTLALTHGAALRARPVPLPRRVTRSRFREVCAPDRESTPSLPRKCAPARRYGTRRSAPQERSGYAPRRRLA
jgi:hypothetical protein